MNNKEETNNLKNWLFDNNINKIENLEKLKQIFYEMDKCMKVLHTNNYYISDFNINNIMINNQVSFKKISMMDSEDKNYFIKQNIFYMACLELGIYSDCLDYINPENKEYFREHFDDFSLFLPEDVRLYYKGIFVNDYGIYLSDFILEKTKREIKNNQLFNSDGSTNNVNGKSSLLSKSTFVGRMLADDNNAFVRIILFPFIILFMSILIPLLIVLSK